MVRTGLDWTIGNTDHEDQGLCPVLLFLPSLFITLLPFSSSMNEVIVEPPELPRHHNTRRIRHSTVEDSYNPSEMPNPSRHRSTADDTHNATE